MTENNKVVYNGQTLIDLTQDDVTASDVRSGVYFHSANGVRGQGTLTSTSIPTADTIAEWDNDTHMNSEDMTSQEVEDFVDGLNISGREPIIKVVLWADSAQTVPGYSGVTREGIDVSSSIPSGYTMVAVIPAIAGGYACYFYTAIIKTSTTVTYQIGNRESGAKTVTPQLNLVCINSALL